MARQVDAQPSARVSRVPWLVLVLCILLTATAAAVVAYREREAARTRFANSVLAARTRIESRMATYVALLRGSAGLLALIDPISEEQFRVFVERMRLRENYPGTQGVGYTRRFGAVSVTDATELAHAEGWNVSVWPDTPRSEVHAIVLIEPRDARNVAALGYDMHSEAVRQEAMDRARDEGAATLSGHVTLVQEITAEKQVGVLLYMPVWKNGVMPPTVEERRAKLQGYVYAPLRTGDLFDGIFGAEPPPVAIELFDGESTPIYASPGVVSTGLVRTEQLPIAGRVWTARFSKPVTTTFPLALDVVALGLLLSTALFVAIRDREEARARELRSAAEAAADRRLLRFAETFVGVLGHDLRNPLSAITLSAQSILDRHPEDAATERYSQRILTSGRRMARMIDQILDLTRARLGGGIAVVPQPLDLGAVAHDVVDEIARARPRVRIDLASSGDLAGSWDPDRIAQVLSNLVGNAVQHDAGAPVRVDVFGTSPERVVVTVHNEAAIPEAEQPYVFDPFRRGSEARPSTGLGLGLFISRTIVEGHGGTLELSSAAGAGTTFTMTLPRVPKERAAPRPSQVARVP